jgi:transcriptional regulator with XRE-family HTH domain
VFVFSGEKLRRERERKGLSREQLALASALSASSIAMAETGWRRPSRAALLRMATALGVSPRSLVDADPAFSAVAR